MDIKPFAARTLMLFCTAICLYTLGNCTSSETKTTTMATPASAEMPEGAKPIEISTTDVHCWVEGDHLFITGICNNNSNFWQQIWLKAAPLEKGKPLQLKENTNNVFRAFSDAIPPRGRSSFFSSIALEDIKGGTPDSCDITCAGAVEMGAGAILIAEEPSGVKVMAPKKINDTTSVQEEKQWLASVVINNPLEVQAAQPRVELLIYGTDEKLWMTTILNPDDPQQRSYVSTEREGPMGPKDKRRISALVFYENLPQTLKDIKIGRLDFLPFNAR